MYLAEREGFEPSVRASVHLISSQAHSASLAPLRGGEFYYHRKRKAKEEARIHLTLAPIKCVRW